MKEPNVILDLNNIRGKNRSHDPIKKDKIGNDPITFSCEWIKDALNLDIVNPNSAIVSSASLSGDIIKPNARVVLVKEVNEKGYVFYSHYNSVKGQELENNPYVSLLFFWDDLARQIRISGKIEKLSPEKSDEYFHSRPRGSQISACISNQSRPISDRQSLDEKMNKLSIELEGKDINRPDTWGGYVIIPEQIEFWQGQHDRMHDRILFVKNNNSREWEKSRLEP
jgi:pyridoxamine 5'-phosphate oxidase